ncbi:hypothetical protein [Sphingomonas flavalba]|uniref:hypothetical protein n=1 Tax=Sphingomonas flavalba TaxID=2559804 RepID=UPI00109E1B69|nr:hypothetical protein [Sphingomonas flavalba]
MDINKLLERERSARARAAASNSDVDRCALLDIADHYAERMCRLAYRNGPGASTSLDVRLVRTSDGSAEPARSFVRAEGPALQRANDNNGANDES